MANLDQRLPLKHRNSMTAAALKHHEGCPIEFIKNPKNGNVFFMCGTKTGYVSPNARELMAQEGTTLDDFTYNECCKPDLDDKVEANWIPCLSIRNKDNIIKSF